MVIYMDLVGEEVRVEVIGSLAMVETY